MRAAASRSTMPIFPRSRGTIDDMVTDKTGRAYVGDLGFDLKSGIKSGPYGRIILVEAGREPRVVADGLNFPNGIAISADGRQLVVAETNGDCLARFHIRADGSLEFDRRFGQFRAPDGICMDRDQAVMGEPARRTILRSRRAGRAHPGPHRGSRSARDCLRAGRRRPAHSLLCQHRARSQCPDRDQIAILRRYSSCRSARCRLPMNVKSFLNPMRRFRTDV